MKHDSHVSFAWKWVCMLLAVLLLLPVCTVPASAADGEGVIAVSAVEAGPGETVSVPVVITDNPGIAVVRLTAAYDAALTFGGATDSGLIPGGLHQVTAQNPVILYWNNHLAAENVTTDGTLAVLAFTVPENAETGTVYPITLTAAATDILSADAEPASVTLAAGSITVVHRHTLTSVSAKAATCVAEGNIAYQVCEDCGDYLTSEGDVIADKNVTVAKDASNHVGPMERTGAVAATEEAEGYTGDVRCAGCDTVVTAGTTIARLDHTHDMVYTAAASATCTDTGNIAYYRCASCGKYYNDEAGTKELTAAQTVVAATGHNWSAWSDPVTSEDGTAAVSTRTCSGCNTTETRTVEIEKQISSDTDTAAVTADVYTSEDNTDAEIAVTTIEVTDETAETVTIDATAAVSEDTTVSAVTLSADAVSTVTSEDNSVSEVAITTSAGTVQMDTAALSGIADEGDGSVTITMSVTETTEETSAEDEVVAGMNESQQETLASVTADENTEVAAAVDVSAGGAHELGTTVTISIPYTPAEGEDVSNISVIYIDDNGQKETLYAEYDEESGCLIFETTHFSVFIVLRTTAKETPPAEDDTPVCIADRETDLMAGTLQLYLNGTGFGAFAFDETEDGWTIRREDGGYLAVSGSTLTEQDTPFAWTWKNGTFSHSAGKWWFFKTTYYLTEQNGEMTVAKRSSGIETTFRILVESTEHTFGAWNTEDGVHTRVCIYCGAAETGECTYADNLCTVCGAGAPGTETEPVSDMNVNVTVTKKSLFIFCLYQVNIEADGENCTAETVEYSTDGETYTTGTSFTSFSAVDTLYIRVTDNNGCVTHWIYENGETKEAAN